MTDPAPHPDSFNARTELAVGDRRFEIFSLTAGPLAAAGDVARLPYGVKVLLENLLRHEDGLRVTASDVAAVAAWGRHPDAHGANAGDDAREIAFTPERVLMQDFTGVPGVVDLAAMRDALGGPRRLTLPDQPAGPGGARDRPLGDRRALRGAGRLRRERGHRVRTQHRALPAAPLGPGLVRPVPGGAAGYRDLPPGQPRAPVAGRVRHPRRSGLLRHTRRHRLAHHHGQRPGRPRLGGGGHRGRGGHARPAPLDAAATGGRAAALRRDGRGDDGHRPRAHHHRAAAPPRRGGQVRRGLRARGGRRPPRDPGHHRQHVPRVRGHLHHLPHRRRHRRLPALHRARRGPPGPGGGLRQGPGALARARGRRAGLLRDRRARPLHRGAQPGRAGPAPGPGAAGRVQNGLPGRPRSGAGAALGPPRAAPTSCATATW